MEITNLVLSIETVLWRVPVLIKPPVSFPYAGWFESLEYKGFWIYGNFAFKIVLPLSVS